MTFIASVVARNGVAIIADSLVTNTHAVVEIERFLKLIDSKNKNGKKEIKLNPQEIFDLFENKPSHTKNFEEKLFMYDKYTAITTAGSAKINDKRISRLISDIIDKNNKKKKSYNSKSISTKISEFCSFLKEEALQHLEKHTTIRQTTFIVTHFEKITNKTIVYKINLRAASKKTIEEDKEFELIQASQSTDIEKVICEGQNRIAERILYGEFYTIFDLIPKIVNQVFDDFKIDKSNFTNEYFEKIRKNKNIIHPTLFSDMKMFKLTELSIQQAVDLANLLMHIEMDFQNYTEDIPTVGGVIKIAVIDKNGFKFIAGDDIKKPFLS
jgi:hypothetical protein